MKVNVFDPVLFNDLEEGELFIFMDAHENNRESIVWAAGAKKLDSSLDELVYRITLKEGGS